MHDSPISYVALNLSKIHGSGVYHYDGCHTARDQLNHAVTLVGYGTTDEGESYSMGRRTRLEIIKLFKAALNLPRSMIQGWTTG